MSNLQGTPRFIDGHAFSSMEARIVSIKSGIAAVQKLADDFERLRKAAEEAQVLRDDLANAEHDLAQMRADSLAYAMQRIGTPVISYRPLPGDDNPITAQIDVTFTSPEGGCRTVPLRSLSAWSNEAKALYAQPEIWPGSLMALGNGKQHHAQCSRSHHQYAAAACTSP
ncbi:hypothetical protein [Cupriavidus sp. RAF12]|uniref:hypothetical protein n=1 Tax=Cupriavidus sp. RAF12 TaxID=3233050 RepID=UPI003F8E144B